jgi:hypothetical protein
MAQTRSPYGPQSIKVAKAAAAERQSEDTSRTDQVQQEHIKFTTWLADNNLDLPLPDQPMTEEEHKQTQANWRELCAGKGQIRIPDNASPECKAEMRAMHASLLFSKQGRRLLEQVLHPKTKTAVEPIKINEAQPDPAKTREQRASRLRDRDTLLPVTQAEIDGLRKEIDTLQAQRGPVALKISDLKRKQRKLQSAPSSSKSSLSGEEKKSRAELEDQLAALNEQIRPFDTKLKALDKTILPLEEGLGAYGKWEPPPPGLADPHDKVLTLRQGLRDSEIICYGEDDAKILTPAFLVYGHELVLCARRRAGIDNITDLGDSALDRKWGNLEEYGTIHGDDEAEDKVGGLCENKLRADYKLPPCKYVRSKTQDEVEVDEANAL